MPFWRWRRRARAQLTPIANELLLTERQREHWLWLRWLCETGQEGDRVTDMPGPYSWVPTAAGVAPADAPRPMVLPAQCRNCDLRRITRGGRAYCAANGTTIVLGRQGTEDEQLKNGCPSWQKEQL